MIHADSTSNSQQPRDKGFWWMALLSSIALGAALWASWQRPVWHDELYNLYLARMPVADPIEALRVDSGPPLHYLLCHLLYLLVGWQEGSNLGTFMVRLPSVLAFTALPWVVWRWARLQGAGGWWAPLLTTVWLPMLYFATEARAFALLALVNGVVWLFGADLVTRGGWCLFAFTALAAALPMLHYAGAFSFLLLPSLAFFVPGSRRKLLAMALLVAAVPVAVWSPVIFGAPEESMGWVDVAAGPGRPGMVSLEVLAPAGPYPALFEAPERVVAPAISLGALLIVLGCGIAGVWRVAISRNREPASLRVVTPPAIGLLAVANLGILALWGWPVYFAGRTESMVWLVTVCLVAAVVAELPKAPRLIAVAPYLVIGAWTMGVWLLEIPDRPQSLGVEIAIKIAPELRSNDLVVVAGLWQLEIEQGLAMASRDASGDPERRPVVRTLPRSQSDHPGWLDQKALISPDLLREAGALQRHADDIGGRVWLIWSPILEEAHNILPAFAGWRSQRMLDNTVVVVDVLVADDTQAARSH